MLFIVGLAIFGVGCVVVIFHEAWISRAVRIWSSAYACDKYVSADSVFPDLDNHLVHVISKTRTDDVAQPGAMSAAQSPAQSDANAAAVFVPVDAGGSEAKSAGSPTVSGASSAHTHSAALTDPDLHLPFPDCVRFKRIVEMWQWTKAPHTHTGYEGLSLSSFSYRVVFRSQRFHTVFCVIRCVEQRPDRFPSFSARISERRR